MLTFAVCILAHAVLAVSLPSPWLVPNLTLVGMAQAITTRPSRWFMVSVLAALSVMGWAIRFAAPIFAGYWLVGAAMRVIIGQWETADVRLQCVLAGVACACVTFGALWLDGLWSWRILGGALVHVAATGCAPLAVHRLLGRRSRVRRAI